MKDFTALVSEINNVHQWFSNQAARQVNTALTLRNWVFGMYIKEYEQHGMDRAGYGDKLLITLADALRKNGIRGVSDKSLRWCRSLYDTYPQIWKTVFSKFQLADNQLFIKIPALESPSGDILQALSAKSQDDLSTDPELLVNHLGFSHFIELLKADTPLKRVFYETQAISNNWSVRELQRAMGSLLFERTGLSTDKAAMLEKHRKGTGLQPQDILRNPYILEFLNLEEKPTFSESDLETAIIDHLQQFLMEMGRGFCFEHRQKRITFGNKHYRIDLVFYHRILKCHVLFDLKIGEFDHADAGQMNVYLNYYKDQEMTEGDAHPSASCCVLTKTTPLFNMPRAGWSSRFLWGNTW
jgi:predicted nuclease of restriction endonuclease-like (RecB) superfamily